MGRAQVGVERGSGVIWGVKVKGRGSERMEKWGSEGARKRGGVGGGAGALYRTSIGSHTGRGMKNGTRSHVHEKHGGVRGGLGQCDQEPWVHEKRGGVRGGLGQGECVWSRKGGWAGSGCVGGGGWGGGEPWGQEP